MKGYDYPESVLKGIGYLDATYPDWWVHIDTAALDMYDPRAHILAYVNDKLVYETKEVVFWSRRELSMHGFMPAPGMEHFAALTAEWSYQIRRIQRERK